MYVGVDFIPMTSWLYFYFIVKKYKEKWSQFSDARLQETMFEESRFWRELSGEVEVRVVVSAEHEPGMMRLLQQTRIVINTGNLLLGGVSASDENDSETDDDWQKKKTKNCWTINNLLFMLWDSLLRNCGKQQLLIILIWSCWFCDWNPQWCSLSLNQLF